MASAIWTGPPPSAPRATRRCSFGAVHFCFCSVMRHLVDEKTRLCSGVVTVPQVRACSVQPRSSFAQLAVRNRDAAVARGKSPFPVRNHQRRR